MALRIGGAKPPMPAAEEQMPPDMPTGGDLPTQEDLMGAMPDQMDSMSEPGMMPGGGLPKPIAVYRDPQQGPFKCGNCQYYMDGSCEFVEGPIDAEGFCNIFNSKSAAQGPMDQEEANEPPVHNETAEDEADTQDQGY